MDIDFGAGLEAAGCRRSEIPARPCEEANVGPLQNKDPLWGYEEREGVGGTEDRGLFYSGDAGGWFQSPRLTEIHGGRVDETAHDYRFRPPPREDGSRLNTFMT